MVATGPPGAAALLVFTSPLKMCTANDLSVDENELFFLSLWPILILQYKLSPISSKTDVLAMEFDEQKQWYMIFQS